MIAANILFAYADGPDRYWSFALPAIIVGDAGAMLVYTHAKYAFPLLSPLPALTAIFLACSIAIFETTPSHMAGTVGAIFNGALQLGSAVGIAAISSIETSVARTHGGPSGYAGRAAAWWFLVGVVALEALAVAVFYRVKPRAVAQQGADAKAAVDGAGVLEEAKDADGEKVDLAKADAEDLPLPRPPPRVLLGRTDSDMTLTNSFDGKNLPHGLHYATTEIV